ncbi:MAG TPA: DUF2071 domain-containing protein [Candidatus Acidoferrum sp.]|nr:DUF2071 domain-containing protein [Candidatus Acidoferrum sp.]
MTETCHLEDADRGRVFLTAEWHNLLMLNYEVPREILASHVPRGTELDSFGGKIFVSLVGFQFLRTRMFGFVPIPFHVNFDEVNLRFYIRRRHPEGDRRGVVFIREIVPKFAIARIARWFYGERYSSFPMRHEVRVADSIAQVSYGWKYQGDWCVIHGESSAAAVLPAEGSLEQFIVEHYWGYCSGPRGRAFEYRVTHPLWNVRRCETGGLDGDVTSFYGPEFAPILSRTPDSAFIAEGSPVAVHCECAIT